MAQTALDDLIAIYKEAQLALIKIITGNTGAGTKTYYNTILKQTEALLNRLSAQTGRYIRTEIPKEYKAALDQTYDYFKRNNLQMKRPESFAQMHSDAVSELAAEMQHHINEGISSAGRRVMRYADTARDNALRHNGLRTSAVKIASGQTVRDMQKDLTQRLSEDGFLTVQYGSGKYAYQVGLDSYAAMVARSTTREAGNLAREKQLVANGYDLVIITKHSPTCELCARVQGRVFSISGKDKRFPPLSEAFPSGYRNVHPNCRCVAVPWIEELQSPEELRAAIAKGSQPLKDERSAKEKALYTKEQAERRQMRADRLQFERYKARLGDDAPQTFSAFRRIKNEDGDRWEALQKEYRQKFEKVDIADNAMTTKVNESKAIPDTSSSFAPAKTIEEAEKFALENGVRHVDYSDLPLETANLLNEAAMTLPEDIRPAYIGSGKSVQKVTGKKFSRKEKDYYGVHMDVLQMHFGEYPNIEYDFEGGNVVGISTAYKTPEKIHKSKVEGNKAYAEKHDGHTQFFNEDGKSTAFHEMGHIYADKKGIPEGFAEDAERWLKESKCDMLKSTDEAWAEAWGAYHTKNPDLPDYIAEYVENATNTPMKIDYMSNSFRPKYFDSITDISIGDISISTKQVENSKFDLVTEVSEGRRSKAVRLAEKKLKEVQKYLPDNFELPKIAVIDFDEYGLNKDAIGGYHAQSGVMLLNSKFDTTAKVLQYVNAQKGQFANTTELAPILHELGHKYYEDCVKSLAKEQKIGYNNAKEIIDSKIQSFIHDNIPNEISKVISKYADNGYKKHKYTELVAECFSVRNSNDTADKLISLLKGEKTI